MSAKVSGKVWDLDLPHNKLLVLLALADHADHEGNNVYPSLGLVAWKTGYSQQQCRRVMSELEKDGILIAMQRRQGFKTIYRIDVNKGNQKLPYTPSKMSPVTKSNPFQKDTSDPLHFDTSTPNMTSLKNSDEPYTEPSIEPSILASSDALPNLNTNTIKENPSQPANHANTPTPNGGAPPPTSEADQIVALIKAYLDVSGTIKPAMYGNKTVRAEAKALDQHGITPFHIGLFIKRLRQDEFWKGKEIKWAKVCGEIVTHFENRPAVMTVFEPETPIEPIVDGDYDPNFDPDAFDQLIENAAKAWEM